MAVLQENLDVMTRFGKLTIPFSEIRRIDFGLHLAEGIPDKIDNAIKQLGSEAFRDRDDAAKELVLLGGQAFPSLQRASRHPDTEVAQRALHIMKRIGEKVTPEQLRLKEEDVICRTCSRPRPFAWRQSGTTTSRDICRSLVRTDTRDRPCRPSNLTSTSTTLEKRSVS